LNPIEPCFAHGLTVGKTKQRNATLAQLVERLIRNQQVAGSIPAGGSTYFQPFSAFSSKKLGSMGFKIESVPPISALGFEGAKLGRVIFHRVADAIFVSCEEVKLMGSSHPGASLRRGRRPRAS
jgi:hypothetical protein